MKKFSVLTLAALMVAAFAIPATALENQFGGYFDVRAFTQQNFTGEDETEDMDVTMVDTRTRIYYTAKINDNLKLVNKFEFDAVWGGPTDGYGDIGADGVDLEIKNTYADFNLGPVNAKIGTQGTTLARGFLFDDDFSGAIITYNGEGFSIPFIWMKAYEGGMGDDKNADVDYYGLAPSLNLGEMITINPYFLYVTSDNLNPWANSLTGLNFPDGTFDELDTYYFGVDVDAKFEMGSVWFTGIYQGGEVDVVNTSLDISAWLAAIGGSTTLGPANVHGQFFYASGDDDATDNDINVFTGPLGQSYYWSEIMGLGLFDGARESGYGSAASNNSCGDAISNIMAANIGASFSPMEKLNVGLDLWYAELAEDIPQGQPGAGESKLGTEVDLKLSYELVEGLNLDVVGAYLFAGDATTVKDPNDADPYEIGTQLSLSF